MISADTSLGGPNGRFPETTLGVLSLLREGAPGELYQALNVLSERYWKPIYAFIRVTGARTNEDAKDLTQAFFLWLQESEALRRFKEERGSLRGYLKILLKRFVKDQVQTLQRLKRGGGRTILSLSCDSSGLEELLVDPRGVDPETIYERVWRTELVSQAIDRLKDRARSEGNGIAFSVFEGYDLVSDAQRPTYAELGARLGLSEQEVKKHLFGMRSKLLGEIRIDLARQTASDRDLDDEWESLFGA
jgi:RNA polymerase sigma-70 factor (ECF subfamily)